MPTFPIYRGELPESLNPLNPRHYWLLAYWVFFRPTALNCYFYQAAPDLYRQGGWRKFLGTFKIRPYRHLYVMAFVSCLFWAGLVGVMAVLYSIATLQGHTASINVVTAISNQQAISASTADFSYGATLKVWDLERGAVVRTLEGHRNGINAMAVVSGDKAISSGSDRSVKIWDLNQGTVLHTLENHSRWVNDLAVTPDGKQVISASADNTLTIWNLERGTKVQTLKGHEGQVNAAIVTPDGQFLLSGSGDRTVKVWNLQQGTVVKTLAGHTGGINALALTPDGKLAISASADGTLKVWNLPEGTLLHTLEAHSGGANVVVVTPDGQQAVSGGADRTVKVWNLAEGTLQHTLASHGGWVNAVAITPDGKQAVSASSDHTLKVWDIEAGTELYTLVGHQEWVRSVAVTPDGTRAISGAGDRMPKVWDLASGREIPLTAANRILFFSTVGWMLVAALMLVVALFASATILACGLMAFGVTGSVGAMLLLGLVGSLLFTWTFVFSDIISIKPSFRQMAAAVSLPADWIAIAFAIVLGTIWFVAFGIAGRTAIAVFGSLALFALMGTAVALFEATVLQNAAAAIRMRLVSGIKAGWQVGVSFNLLVALGALRAIFYPVNFAGAWRYHSGKRSHPVYWDELMVLPVPNSGKSLLRLLHSDEEEGLRAIAAVSRNPFQRWVAQRTLHAYLHSHPVPLQFLYTLLRYPDLQAYISPPISSEDWLLLPESRQVLLGELGHTRVECSSDWVNRVAERLVWVLTVWPRSHRRTPLTRFAAILAEWSGDNPLDATGFDFSAYKSHLLRLRDYPGGEEILESFAALSAFLCYNDISQLQGAADVLRSPDMASLYETRGDELIPVSGTIRPEVLVAIARLGQIAAGLCEESDSNAPGKRLAALARGIVAIEALETFAIAEIVTPEQTILRRIISKWRSILTQVMAEVADKAQVRETHPGC